MDTKIIERMKKLLAMSQDASSEHEAMIAARRLHALMSKHDISLSELESKEQDQVDEDGFKTINLPYRRWIAQAIAELYYCKTYYITGGGLSKNHAQLMVVGKEHHRQIALVIIDQVLRLIDRLARQSCLEALGYRQSTYISSFQKGAAVAICDRCIDLVEAARAGTLVDEETGNTLPVLASLYDQEEQLIDQFLESMDFTKRKQPKTKPVNPFAVASGAEAGKQVPLHQELPKTAPKLLSGA
jgi:hypothetical protein